MIADLKIQICLFKPVTMCLFPTCTRHPEKNGFCIFHKMYSSSTEPKKEVYKIPKRSVKEKEVMKELKKLYPIYLKENPICAINSKVCTKKATCIHHTKGRGKNVLNAEDWLPSCTKCNLFIEENHKWAHEKGFKKKRIT